MADERGYYWDYRTCAWERCPAPERVEVPQQPTGVEEREESDVRSG